MDELLNQTVAGDILDTPELETPPAVPDAHEGEIVSVTSETYDSGSTSINVTVQSKNAGFQDTYKIFPPKEFVSHYAEVVADPTSLSDVAPEGKKQSPRQRFAAVVANTTKDAEIQRLRNIATEELGPEGVAARMAGLSKPTSFTGFIETLNTLLTGVPCVFTRKADENSENAQYRNKLRVNRIYGTSIMGSAKALKNYAKAWE